MSGRDKIREVDVREIWDDGQFDFAGWLIDEDNLDYLNEVLGLEFTSVEKDVTVEPYDYTYGLVAFDGGDGAAAVIEYQPDASDFEHLGRLVTYAAGIEARAAVWIVEYAKDEHWDAVDWLNRNGGDCVFYLLELHAFQFGDSEPSPVLELVC